MSKICPICSTVNEQDYKFCKNCGHSLCEQEEAVNTDRHPTSQFEQPENTGGENPNQNNFIARNYNGVSVEEMAAFIGKKAGTILPKFTKMEVTGSKTSWCWPAAILGLLFGPLGSALWFFYRKMYKPAVIFSIIGAVASIITAILSFSTANIPLDDLIDTILSANSAGAIEILQNMHPQETWLSLLSGLIADIFDIGAFLVSGLYGYYIYKNHCINKITTYRAYQADERYYKIGLASIGGISGGMLALGIILIVIIENISSFVTALVNMIF